MRFVHDAPDFDDLLRIVANQRRLIPGSRLEIITGGGHTSSVEEPEEVNRVLLSFITDAEAGLRGESGVTSSGVGSLIG